MLTSSTTSRRWGSETLVPTSTLDGPDRLPALRVDESLAADGTGKRVCVCGGAFSGLKGVLLRTPPHRPALVRVEFLGRPVDLEIEPSLLKVC